MSIQTSTGGSVSPPLAGNDVAASSAPLSPLVETEYLADAAANYAEAVAAIRASIVASGKARL